MSKKIPLILIVGILGLLSAGALWFMTKSGSVSPLLGGVYMDRTVPGIGVSSSQPAREPMMMEQGMDKMGTSIAPMPPTYYPYPGDALNVADRSIQKYAYHSVVVNNVDEYMKNIKEYFQSIGGTVLSYNQGTSQYDYLYGNLTVKVPQEKFDEAVNRVTQDVKKVITASVDVQDITGEVVAVNTTLQDLQDRKAEQEISLAEAANETERRRIQLEIDRLNRQIEQYEQSQQNQEERINYGTLNISVANREYNFNGGGPRPLLEVVQEAWRSLKSTGFGILYFLIWVVVYAAIWIPVVLLARWIWGKVRPTAPKSVAK